MGNVGSRAFHCCDSVVSASHMTCPCHKFTPVNECDRHMIRPEGTSNDGR